MVPSPATDEKNMAICYKALDGEMGFEHRISTLGSTELSAPSTTTHSRL